MPPPHLPRLSRLYPFRTACRVASSAPGHARSPLIRGARPSILRKLTTVSSMFRVCTVPHLQSNLILRVFSSRWLWFIHGLIVLHIFTEYQFSMRPTQGPSMLPTMSSGTNSWFSRPWIIVSKRSARGKGVAVGDIVVAASPIASTEMTLCKRIVGMPGDLISVVTPGKSEEHLGKENVEGFGEFQEEMFRVPEGHCWLVGDNLHWSRDSRIFGLVPLNLIRGRVLAVVWPWADWKWFKGGAALDNTERN